MTTSRISPSSAMTLAMLAGLAVGDSVSRTVRETIPVPKRRIKVAYPSNDLGPARSHKRDVKRAVGLTGKSARRAAKKARRLEREAANAPK